MFLQVRRSRVPTRPNDEIRWSEIFINTDMIMWFSLATADPGVGWVQMSNNDEWYVDAESYRKIEAAVKAS